MHKVLSEKIVVNVFGKKELTAGFKFVYTDFVVLFPYLFGGRLFLCSCELCRKYIS